MHSDWVYPNQTVLNISGANRADDTQRQLQVLIAP